MTTAPGHAGGDWTPGDVAAMVANPFYAIEIDPELGAVEPTVSDEEWVDANATALIRNPKRWLSMLLRVLQGNASRIVEVPIVVGMESAIGTTRRKQRQRLRIVEDVRSPVPDGWESGASLSPAT